MVLRCARLERILASRASSFSLACRRHVSLSTVSSQLPLVHAEQSTQADSHSPDVTVHPPPRPKVAEYLQYVAQNSAVTLEDLESFRPESHSPVGSAEFQAEYEALVAKLDRSFTVKQLREFLHLYGIPVSSRMRKLTAASTIIEKKWGWPSLAKSQKLARSRKEISTSIFPLDPHQAFLLLGKDGNEILSLSRTYNVRLQFSHKPLSLTITGTTASVEKLEQHVETLKEEIVRQDFVPPLQVDLSASLQALSRSSGCFLESLLDGKVRIWYRKSSKYSASLAKKLIMQHAIEDVKVPLAASPLKTGQGQATHQASSAIYAFYPFFCGRTRSLEEKSGFRLRRVGRWFGQERVVAHIGVDVTHGFVGLTGEHADAREQLLAQVEGLGGDRTLSVTATPGYIVLSPQGSSAFSLSPPLEGRRDFSEVMDWVREESPSTEFIHSPPILFWQAPDPGQPWRRRLVYETTPTPMGQMHILVCEYTPQKDIPVEVRGNPVDVNVTSTPTLRGGPVTRLDVVMPDETRDLRLTLTCNRSFPEESWPNELSELVINDAPSPTSDAPLVFEHETKQYFLKEDTFVQSGIFPIEPEGHLVNITSERRFDHQSSESYLSSEVHCSDLSSDVAWQIFWNRCEKVVQDISEPQLDKLHD